jgi:xanthine dehydrogenase accessory factor
MPGESSLTVLAEVPGALARHGRVALCHLLRAEGSTPGKAGWRMLVTPDGEAIGNLGGGAFEAMVKADALSRLQSGVVSHGQERYYLTERAVQGQATGMVCGGMAEVLLEILVASPTLVVCGGGPVGQALARAGELAGFSLLVADDRAAFRDPADFPAGTSFATLPPRGGPAGDAAAVAVDAPPSLAHAMAERAGRELAVAVVTRCWETDLEALREVLGPPPGSLPPGVGYLGLMGSRRKIARIRQELAGQGYRLDQLPLRAPIGLAIGGDTPGEIAIAVLAEVLALRHRSPLAEVEPAREPDAASTSNASTSTSGSPSSASSPQDPTFEELVPSA